MPLLAVDPRHGEALLPLEQAPVVRGTGGGGSVFVTYADSDGSDADADAPEAPAATAPAAELESVAAELASKRTTGGDGDSGPDVDTFVRNCAHRRVA